MYATINELLTGIRRAAKSYPAEMEQLRRIADLAKRNLAEGAAAFADWQSAISGSRKAEQPQPIVDGAATQNALPGEPGSQPPGALEPVQTRNDAPDDALRTETAQSASGGITGQSAQPDKMDAGALPAAKPDVEADSAGLPSGASPSIPVYAVQPDSPTQPDAGQEAPESATTQSTLPGEVQALSVAPESTQTGAERAGDTSPTSAPQNAPESATVQSTLSGKANSQPDDAAARLRLREQIEGCLVMENDPIRRVFLQQLQHDCLACSIDASRREMEAYLQPGSLCDFLSRLAALRLHRALDGVNDDPDGRRLERGDTKDREAVLKRVQAAFEQEADAVLRLRLAKIAHQAVTDPLGARNEMTGYNYGRADWEWVWFATVGTLWNAENAFRWRLEEARRQVQAKDVWLLNLLDKTERIARKNLPRAISNLEALTGVAAAINGQADAAQDATDNPVGFPAAVA